MKKLMWMGCCLALGASSMAGTLTPPGAPAPTMKPLSEIEPRVPIQSLTGDATAAYVISQPGSYYLTGNVVVSDARGGILVTTDSVTIDLAGFQLLSTGGGNYGGIRTDVITRRGTVVRNGSVSGFPGTGVRLGSYSRAENLRVQDCVSRGITVEGSSLILNCEVTSILPQSGVATAIQASNGSLIQGNTVGELTSAASFTSRGIEASASCVIADNTVYQINNTAGTAAGIYATGSSTVVRNCTVNNLRGTSVEGILGAGVLEGNGVENLTAANGNCYGMRLVNGGRAMNNRVTRAWSENGSGIGISAESGASVEGNVVTDAGASYYFPGNTINGFGIVARQATTVKANKVNGVSASAVGISVGIHIPTSEDSAGVYENYVGSVQTYGTGATYGIRVSSNNALLLENRVLSNAANAFVFDAGTTGSRYAGNIVKGAITDSGTNVAATVPAPNLAY